MSRPGPENILSSLLGSGFFQGAHDFYVGPTAIRNCRNGCRGPHTTNISDYSSPPPLYSGAGTRHTYTSCSCSSEWTETHPPIYVGYPGIGQNFNHPGSRGPSEEAEHGWSNVDRHRVVRTSYSQTRGAEGLLQSGMVGTAVTEELRGLGATDPDVQGSNGTNTFLDGQSWSEVTLVTSPGYGKVVATHVDGTTIQHNILPIKGNDNVLDAAVAASRLDLPAYKADESKETFGSASNVPVFQGVPHEEGSESDQEDKAGDAEK